LRRVQENSSSARLLFWTHMGFADVFEWRGDTPHAVGACVEAVNLAKAVRDKFPESELWRRNLRVALSRYGDAVKRRGEDALGWYQRALALFESTSPDVQRPAAESTDYAFLLNKIGREWLDKGDTQGASGAHSVALRIYGGLSAGAPDRVDYRHGVMITRTDLGNICAKIGDWKQASGHYQAAMQIAVQQLQADPQSMEAKRDVGLLNVKVGHVLAAIGDTENALAAFRGGLSLVQPIAESDPGNREYQHDVARAQFYVGQAAARLGQMPDAGVALRESVRIFQALTTINPANVAWREGLREADKLLAAN
jgi:tetratricopeptide (TPR) repeat protein